MMHGRWMVCVAAALVVTAAQSLSAQTIERLGTLREDGQGFSDARAVSADGLVVAGSSSDDQGNTQAFVWTRDAGMAGLGFLPGAAYSFSYCTGLSADGSTAVGSSYDSQGRSVAFAWNEAEGMFSLGSPSGRDSQPYAVSADGSAVVGYSYGEGGYRAFRWTAADGFTDGLGTLSPSGQSEAFDVSADGNTVVGDAINQAGDWEAFVWTEATGMIGLGTPVPPAQGYAGSYAWRVSANGAVATGSFYSYDEETDRYSEEPFLWTAATGRIMLGRPAGATEAYPTALSADGTTVAGNWWGPNGNGSFRWTAARGMQGLGGLPGVPSSTSLASAISADGTTVVGQAIAPDETEWGHWEATAWTPQTGLISLGLIPTNDYRYSVANAVSASGEVAVGFSYNGSEYEAVLFNLKSEIEVTLDVKPGSRDNSINLTSKGNVPVAVLTTEDFDAADVDPDSVLLGDPALGSVSFTKFTLEDVDADGDVDLLLFFDTAALAAGALNANSTSVNLTGETFDGEKITGSDAVNIVPKGRGR